MNAIVQLGLRSTHTLLHSTGRSATRNIISSLSRPQLYQEIARSRSHATYNVEQIMKREFWVYADGSGYRGGVGGAARAKTPHGTLVMKEYLGTLGDHLPVEGEILGVILGLRIIKSVPGLTRATILTDCQQAIRELVSGKSEHDLLLDRFDRELQGMEKRLGCIRLAWVPGHRGIVTNELVDKDAKAAAAGETSITLYI
ncbi:hypothetical protein B0H11DRAFT_35553 [Mycena galericulata]|nr:hypothetical protein B0H11DRAFT_35553 [Mycena galericulata]